MTENNQGTRAVFNVVDVDAICGNNAVLKVRKRAYKFPLCIIVTKFRDFTRAR